MTTRRPLRSDAGAGLDASRAGGAQEMDRQINRDGALAGFEQGVDGEGRGRVHERGDRPAVQDAAHPRQLFAHVEGEGGRAALGRDELQPSSRA